MAAPLANSSYTTTLPPNATVLESSMEGALSRISSVPVNVGDVWSIANCPSNLLPWLAYALQVQTWDATWSDTVKRSVIANSVPLHQIKGTPAAIKQFFASIGFPGAVVEEGRETKNYDGTYKHDGFLEYGDSGGWAYYRVVFKQLMSVQQANFAKSVLAVIAPLRCQLYGLDFTGAGLIANGYAKYDGSYTYGVV